MQLGLTGSYHALLEQSHRYAAAVVSILVAATFAVAWRQARRDRLVFRSAAAALGLIGVQIALGAIAVFAHNAGWTVALHLAGAWLLVGAVTVAAVAAQWRPRQGSSLPTSTGRLPFASVVSLFALAVIGMLVLHEGAGTACPGWPVCGLGAAPVGLVLLQYLHRFLALLTAVLLTLTAARLWRSHAAGTAARFLAAASVVLVAATASLGAVVATTGAPPVAQDLHLAVASALWIVAVALAGQVARGRSASASQSLPVADSSGLARITPAS